MTITDIKQEMTTMLAQLMYDIFMIYHAPSAPFHTYFYSFTFITLLLPLKVNTVSYFVKLADLSIRRLL